MDAGIPAAVYSPPAQAGLDLIHCDEALLIVNKPAGLLSVPGRGEERQDSLARRVQAEYPEALIVHRLDMATSGLLVLARGKEMHRRLSSLFRERQVDKRYIAVVAGLVEEGSGEVDLPLIADWPNRPRQKVDLETGKPSLTRFKVLARDLPGDSTRLALEPVTGRSHQLRVHMRSLGHSILGDELYGGEAVRQRAERLLLHATSLAFPHPQTLAPVSFACDAPF